jgi:hypothetical protein
MKTKKEIFKERGKFAEVKSISKKKSLTEEGKKMIFFNERMQRKIQKVIKKRSNQANFRSRCKQL